MDCSRRKLIVAFCALVLMTTFFMFTSVPDLSTGMLHRVFDRGFANFSFFEGLSSYYDSWDIRQPYFANSTLRRQNFSVQTHQMNKVTMQGLEEERRRGNSLLAIGQLENGMVMINTSKFHTYLPKRKKIRLLTTTSATRKVFRTTSWHWSSSPNRNVSLLSSSSPRLVQRFPDAIIIGVKKGGTRALLHFLSAHSRVKIVQHEMHFFDKVHNYEKGLEWYRHQMPPALPEDIVMEKTPAYFVTPSAPSRIFKMNPNVKLILTLRDPTRRSISDYAQGIYKAEKNLQKVKPFDDRLFIDKKKTIVNKRMPRINIGLYAVHLKRWFNAFPREHIHIVNGETLVKKPWIELESIQRFLEIPTEITRTNFFFNKTKGFYCLKWKINRFGRKKEASCLKETKGRKHPFISREIITALRKFYGPYNKQLYEMTKTDFGWPVV